MTIFLINVGNTVYDKYTLPLIEKLCDFNNINLFILEQNISQNIYGLHPSWLKLFCHRLVNDDFILCWDLDLVPTKLYNLEKMFNKEFLNMTYDRGFTEENFTFNSKFKYNCGLIGIPKKYESFFENIYYKYGSTAIYPSYEQYYVNDEIYDNSLEINVVDSVLNSMYYGDEIFSENVLNIHYTYKISSNQHRVDLTKLHFEKFKEFFNL